MSKRTSSEQAGEGRHSAFAGRATCHDLRSVSQCGGAVAVARTRCSRKCWCPERTASLLRLKVQMQLQRPCEHGHETGRLWCSSVPALLRHQGFCNLNIFDCHHCNTGLPSTNHAPENQGRLEAPIQITQRNSAAAASPKLSKHFQTQSSGTERWFGKSFHATGGQALVRIGPGSLNVWP